MSEQVNKPSTAWLPPAALLAALITAILTLAAVTPNSFVTVQTPNAKGTAFIQGTDTAGTYKTVYTSGSSGSKVIGIYITSTDSTASHLFTVQFSSSVTAHCVTSCFGAASVTIPISAGYAAASPAVNALSPSTWPGLPIDANGNPYIFLPASSSFTLEGTFQTALGSGSQVNIVVVAGDF